MALAERCSSAHPAGHSVPAGHTEADGSAALPPATGLRPLSATWPWGLAVLAARGAEPCHRPRREIEGLSAARIEETTAQESCHVGQASLCQTPDT